MTTEPTLDLDQNPFVCGTCGRRGSKARDCPECGDPALDLRIEEVRLMLQDEDRLRKERRFKLAIGLGLPFGIASVVLLSYFSKVAAVMMSSLPFGSGFIVAAALVTLTVANLITRFFPAPRLFPYLR